MLNYCFFDVNGYPKAAGVTEGNTAPIGSTVLTTAQFANRSNLILQAGSIVTMPTKPSIYHTWSSTGWVLLPVDATRQLTDAMIAQGKILGLAYYNAIQIPVAYMGTTFQSDIASQDTLNKVLVGLNGTTPVGFYWVDAVNAKISMTNAQLQGLAGVMLAQGWTAFQRLQTRKDALKIATTLAQIQAVVW